MVRYIKATTDPKSFREIRQLRERRKLSNFKVYVIREYNTENKFVGYTNIYAFEYDNKYYISIDILNPNHKRGRDGRSSIHKSFEDKEQANNYFREVVKGKEWEKVQG